MRAFSSIHGARLRPGQPGPVTGQRARGSLRYRVKQVVGLPVGFEA